MATVAIATQVCAVTDYSGISFEAYFTSWTVLTQYYIELTCTQTHKHVYIPHTYMYIGIY